MYTEQIIEIQDVNNAFQAECMRMKEILNRYIFQEQWSDKSAKHCEESHSGWFSEKKTAEAAQKWKENQCINNLRGMKALSNGGIRMTFYVISVSVFRQSALIG